MPVLKNDGLEVLAFMLDVEQDIIWQIGVCLRGTSARPGSWDWSRTAAASLLPAGSCAGSSLPNCEFRRLTSNSSMGGWATPNSRTVCPRAICASAFHDPQMWRS